MLSFGFRIFCWYRGFCHRTGSDLLLFLNYDQTSGIIWWKKKVHNTISPFCSSHVAVFYIGYLRWPLMSVDLIGKTNQVILEYIEREKKQEGKAVTPANGNSITNPTRRTAQTSKFHTQLQLLCNCETDLGWSTEMSLTTPYVSFTCLRTKLS